MPADSRTPVDPARLREAVHYALRFNDRGKAHGVRMRDCPDSMADAVVRYLALCGWQVVQGPPLPAHSTGRLWGDAAPHGLGREDL